MNEVYCLLDELIQSLEKSQGICKSNSVVDHITLMAMQENYTTEAGIVSRSQECVLLSTCNYQKMLKRNFQMPSFATGKGFYKWIHLHPLTWAVMQMYWSAQIQLTKIRIKQYDRIIKFKFQCVFLFETQTQMGCCASGFQGQNFNLGTIHIFKQDIHYIITFGFGFH